MSSTGAPSPSGQRDQQGVAAAIAAVSERASVLVREEIELAKAEISEKATRLAKGAIVGIAAGVFFLVALFFVLIGCAWLLYYELPIGNEFTYFWGFFAMAAILVVLGIIAGLLAVRALRSGAPPTPNMAIEEARKIRETVTAPTTPMTPTTTMASASPVSDVASPAGPVWGEPSAPASSAPASSAPASSTPASFGPPTPPIPQPGAATETDAGKGGGYGTAISG